MSSNTSKIGCMTSKANASSGSTVAGRLESQPSPRRSQKFASQMAFLARVSFAQKNPSTGGIFNSSSLDLRSSSLTGIHGSERSYEDKS